MPIPKIIYQTWKSKDIPSPIKEIQNRILQINPNYQIHFYDDDAMDNFIKTNFTDYVYNSFIQLNVGAAKADFWRYCVLYVNGGIYLDIDSEITGCIDEIIDEADECIITREKNEGNFNNWIMICMKDHPIMKRAIEKCCYNINNRTTNDIMKITGPIVLTEAINEILYETYKIPKYEKKNLWYEKDDVLNELFNANNHSPKCKFYGFDMEKYGKFKNEFANCLYENELPWFKNPKVFKNGQNA